MSLVTNYETKLAIKNVYYAHSTLPCLSKNSLILMSWENAADIQMSYCVIGRAFALPKKLFYSHEWRLSRSSCICWTPSLVSFLNLCCNSATVINVPRYIRENRPPSVRPWCTRCGPGGHPCIVFLLNDLETIILIRLNRLSCAFLWTIPKNAVIAVIPEVSKILLLSFTVSLIGYAGYIRFWHTSFS